MSFSAEDASYLSNITYATMEFSIFSSSWSMLNDRAIFQLQAAIRVSLMQHFPYKWTILLTFPLQVDNKLDSK